MTEKNIRMRRKRSDGGLDDYFPVTNEYVRQIGYGVASGTNAKSITLAPAPTAYVEGMAISFRNTTQNSGAVTLNVNGLGAKSVLKANGTALTSGQLKANSIYTVRYNGSNFILQGEGGEYGNATASQVLAGRTIGTESGLVTGTMPNKATGNHTTDAISRSGNTLRFSIPGDGFYGDGANIQRVDNNWIEANIKQGVSIFEKTGAMESSATGTLMGSQNRVITVSGLAFRPRYFVFGQISVTSGRYSFAHTFSHWDGINMFPYTVPIENWDIQVNNDGFTVTERSGYAFPSSAEYRWIAMS